MGGRSILLTHPAGSVHQCALCQQRGYLTLCRSLHFARRYEGEVRYQKAVLTRRASIEKRAQYFGSSNFGKRGNGKGKTTNFSYMSTFAILDRVFIRLFEMSYLLYANSNTPSRVLINPLRRGSRSVKASRLIIE